MVFRCNALRGVQMQMKFWAVPAVKVWKKILINKVIINIYLLIRLYVTAIFLYLALRILHISFILNSIAQLKIEFDKTVMSHCSLIILT